MRLVYRICICLGMLLAAAVPADAKRVALVIGNAAYKETSTLANPRNDAEDVAAALKRLGFDVLSGFDLDKRAMERLIREFDQKLQGSEVGLFFFAGHGVQVSGQNHLVPIDARLAAEGDVDFESLPLSLVLSRMERHAKTSIVLLDACRDNPLARNLARSMGTRSAGVGQGLAEVRTGVGSLISFSTQPGNVALDGKGRNSPYTEALKRQLETEGQDILSVLAAVRGDVVKSTEGRQVPWEHTSLLGPVVLKAAQATTARPSSPPDANGRRASVEAAAADAWPLVKDASDPAVLEAFLKRYADTFYGDLARINLAKLKQSGAAAAAIAAKAAAPTVALGSCKGPTIWLHNGSEMRLVAEGKKRSFVYHLPRTGLAEVGIKEGTVLFSGERTGNRYEGMARRFSIKCANRDYKVGGEITDERRISLLGTVQGQDPKTCRPGPMYDDELEFEFVRCLSP